MLYSLFLIDFNKHSGCALHAAKPDLYLKNIKHLWTIVRVHLVPKIFFCIMPTLYERLTRYCTKSKNPKPQMLSHEERAAFGRIVCDNYMLVKHPRKTIQFKTFANEEGTFKVISYPKYFIPTVDIMIADYYKNNKESPPPEQVTALPPTEKTIAKSSTQIIAQPGTARIRKRIALKSIPIYSSKTI